VKYAFAMAAFSLLAAMGFVPSPLNVVELNRRRYDRSGHLRADRGRTEPDAPARARERPAWTWAGPR
jgi:hypothetical protein